MSARAPRAALIQVKPSYRCENVTPGDPKPRLIPVGIDKQAEPIFN
jgi:hypothetical protein